VVHLGWDTIEPLIVQVDFPSGQARSCEGLHLGGSEQSTRIDYEGGAPAAQAFNSTEVESHDAKTDPGLCHGLSEPDPTTWAELAQKGDHLGQHKCATNVECRSQQTGWQEGKAGHPCCGCVMEMDEDEVLVLRPARACDNAWCVSCWLTIRKIAEYSSTRFRIHCPRGTNLSDEASESLAEAPNACLDAAVLEVSETFSYTGLVIYHQTFA
jgi:hypothetical protein